LSTVLQELNQIIDLLEAEIPANPESPKNKKLRRRMERALAKYFRDLGDAFPYSKLAGIYNKNVKESLGSDTSDMLDPLLAAFDDEIEAELAGQLSEIYVSGQAEMITWGKTQAGVPIAFEGPPISQAVDWAKKHISKTKLIDGINEETRKQISNVIADGIKNKRGIPGIKSDIRHKFEWMARGAPSDIKGLTLASRAEMIARTETANALSNASLDNMKGMGIDGKQWVTAGDSDVSEECEANEAQGVIPRGDSFTSGPMAPPQHPNCRCAVSPARL